MMLDRSTKTLIAIITLVASLLLVINHLIDQDPLREWLLAGVLFLVSLAFWIWLWQEGQQEETALTVRSSNGAIAPELGVKEWVITKDTVTELETAATTGRAAPGIAEALHSTDAPPVTEQPLVNDETRRRVEENAEAASETLETVEDTPTEAPETVKEAISEEAERSITAAEEMAQEVEEVVEGTPEDGAMPADTPKPNETETAPQAPPIVEATDDDSPTVGTNEDAVGEAPPMPTLGVEPQTPPMVDKNVAEVSVTDSLGMTGEVPPISTTTIQPPTPPVVEETVNDAASKADIPEAPVTDIEPEDDVTIPDETLLVNPEDDAVEVTAPEVAVIGEVDDLQRVEGIGPKYNDALIAAGITTFDQIAAASEEQLSQIIKDAGMRRPSSISTWAEQAALAAKGDWDALDDLQKTLTGGRRD